jgi:hypothetical protein
MPLGKGRGAWEAEETSTFHILSSVVFEFLNIFSEANRIREIMGSKLEITVPGLTNNSSF